MKSLASVSLVRCMSSVPADKFATALKRHHGEKGTRAVGQVPSPKLTPPGLLERVKKEASALLAEGKMVNTGNVPTAGLQSLGVSPRAVTPGAAAAGGRLLANKPGASAGSAAFQPISAAAPGVVESSTEDKPVPKSIIERFKFMFKEYGMFAISLYVGMWVLPAGAAYGVFSHFDNFGHNPISILQFLHVKDTVFGMLDLPPDAKPEGWQISAIYAYLTAEVLEVARLPAAIWLAPKFKRAWQRGGGGGAVVAKPPPLV